MKTIVTTALGLAMAIGAASPVFARDGNGNRTRYEYNGRTYNRLRECQARKRDARKDGAIVGAATAGIGAAVLGANLGEAALIAGGGALVGNQLGKTKKC